ncbi:MAG: DNA polymerase III subunit alpha [Planctomycetota bacterium]|jgi:error-prone DNA polymerase
MVRSGSGGVPYAELSCQSAFSFLRGACEPETLVERAAELGYAGMALTDRDGLYGNPRFHAAAQAAGLHAVHGTTLTLARRVVAGRSVSASYDGTPGAADDRVVLLAEDDVGWSNLCRLVSAARHRSRTEPLTSGEALAAHAGGLIALAGPHLPEAALAHLAEVFGAEHLLLSIHDRLLKRDRRGQAVQRERARRHGLRLVVTGGARFARREDKPLHDVLACVRHRTTLDRAATRLLPNAEFHLRPVAELEQLFRHCPDALHRTVEIAARCRFDMARLAYRFPPFAAPDGETPFSHLHRLVHEGARARYRPLSAAAARQLARELDLIERLDLAGYFLLVHDIVVFCERHEILCQGRGSAANSAVCYALGITSVDPVGMGLLFERFLSENRGEMPDIDLDIEHQRREEVLQYVYARYGRDRAALAAEVITYRARSAVRDAGKALGFTVAEVDVLAKGLDRRWDGDYGAVPEAWQDRKDDPRLPHLLRLVRAMEGLPRHLSIHVGGMIITGPPLTDVMPVEPAAMPGRTVVPWDKDDLSALGILKIDLLGLGMLTVLQNSFQLINDLRRNHHHPPPPDGAPQDPDGVGEGAQRGKLVAAPNILQCERATDPTSPHAPGALARSRSVQPPAFPAEPPSLTLHSIPSDDPATWDMLCAADTVGVFQVESRAQMNCLPRLRPRRFYDLVVEVALIRPGPIQGDMVHPYLRRRAGREPVSYPHPSLRPILERTLGVPLFQEQGMRIAMTAAGFSGSEADELRRAMGHKRSRERMAVLQERFLAGLVRHGIPRAAGERIWAQLSAFADYGFPESHAASFARLAWASAWLKCHHPQAFLCALLNAQPMGFYPPAVLVSDAQRHGVLVLPVDVLQSGWESSLQWAEVPADTGAARATRARGARSDGATRHAQGGVGAPGARHPAPRAASRAPDTAIGRDVSRSSASAGGVMREESAAHAMRYGTVDKRVDRDCAGGEAPGGPVLAVRLGLCTVRGLGEAHAAGVRAGLLSVERLGPFVSPEDFARRCGLDRRQMEHLARLGALGGFEARRRHALWRVARMAHRPPGALAEPLPPDRPVRLPTMGAAEIVRENLALGGTSVERHPLELLRERLAAAGVCEARVLLARGRALETGGRGPRKGTVERPRTFTNLDGAVVHRAAGEIAVAGLVVCRQRPPTAGGLTFLTLEDETGFANLIVTPDVARRDRKGLVASLVLALGRLEHADGVVNVRATRLLPLDSGPLSPDRPIEGLPSHDYR